MTRVRKAAKVRVLGTRGEQIVDVTLKADGSLELDSKLTTRVSDRRRQKENGHSATSMRRGMPVWLIWSLIWPPCLAGEPGSLSSSNLA